MKGKQSLWNGSVWTPAPGGDVAGGGTVTCYACYDENYTNAGGINACP